VIHIKQWAGLLVTDLGDEHAPNRWYAEYEAPGGVIRIAKPCPLAAAAAVLESAARAWKQQEKAA